KLTHGPWGAKYDANNVYLAAMYAETRNMTPYGESDLTIANKTQNFEVTAQYQFDFGLRPEVSYGDGQSGSIVADGGQVYLTGLAPKGTVNVKWGNSENERCTATYSLPTESQNQALSYASAICR
ncbi:porin, partial [Serratia ureilytica]|nr:porin [Serratia ureilytica]